MKITISPTEIQPICGVYNRKVEISIPDDELTLPKVINDLIIPALIAWGFTAELVEEYIPETSE